MTEFRAKDRHPLDRRVLCIRDPQDFELWQNREEFGFNAIAYDYPIDQDIRQLTEIWATHQRMNNLKYLVDENSEIDLWNKSEETIPTPLRKSFENMVNDLTEFDTLMDPNKKVHQAELRVNTYNHEEWMKHGRAMTLPITGLQTLFMDEHGQEYSIPDRLIAFEDFHRGPRKEDNQGGRAYMAMFNEEPAIFLNDELAL